MQDSGPGSFDEPSLKTAVKRIWSEQAAPAELRAKLMQLAAAESEGGRMRLGPYASRHSVMSGLAAAAVILVGLATVSYRLASPSSARRAALALSIPPSLSSDLVARHDACLHSPDHHGRDLPHDDFQLISQSLSTQLHRPALAAPLNEAGWSFRGAAICPVGAKPCGHLVFVHDDEAISVFSLPADSIPAGRGECAAVVSHHPVAGFAQSGGFFCLVGSSPADSLTERRLCAIRDRLERDFQATAAQERVTFAQR